MTERELRRTALVIPPKGRAVLCIWAAAAGLFLGWQNTLLAMFFGIVFGGVYGIYLLAAKKAGKKDHFAFGPFLCAGIVIAMLFGGPVLEWYCAFL